jgi:hypothetical protein
LKLSGLALLSSLAFGCQGNTSCDVDNDCNEPYICAQAESNESYCTGDSCKVDSDCPPSQICEGLECVVEGNNKSKIHTKTIGGIPVSSGFTNAEGRIDFWDSQSHETVNVFARRNGTSLTNAYILFEDGNGFEVFHGDHDGEPLFHIYNHNSIKNLDWNVLGTVAKKLYEYSQDTNDNSYDAAQKYSTHLQNTSKQMGCVLPEEVWLAQDKRITAVIDLVNLTPKIGSEAKKVLTYTKKAVVDAPYNIHKGLVADGKIDPDDCKAYQTWHTIDTFASQNINPLAFSELRNYKCLTSIPKEACYDGIDNDCDGKIDSQDPDCKGNTCTDKCQTKGEKTCITETEIQICTQYTGGCLFLEVIDCSPNVCSEEKLICVEDPGDCEDQCLYKGQIKCAGSLVKTCGDYDKDDCLEWKIKDCGSGKTCKDGECVESIINPIKKDSFHYDFGHHGKNGKKAELSQNWNLSMNGGNLSIYQTHTSFEPSTTISLQTVKKFSCDGDAIIELDHTTNNATLSLTPNCPKISPCKLYNQTIAIGCKKDSSFGKCNLYDIKLTCN